MTAEQKRGRVYVVPFNNQEYLVRAATYRGATNYLLDSVAAKMAVESRVATQDDIIRLVSAGVKVLDAAQQNVPDGDDDAEDGQSAADAP